MHVQDYRCLYEQKKKKKLRTRKKKKEKTVGIPFFFLTLQSFVHYRNTGCRLSSYCVFVSTYSLQWSKYSSQRFSLSSSERRCSKLFNVIM